MDKIPNEITIMVKRAMADYKTKIVDSTITLKGEEDMDSLIERALKIDKEIKKDE